MSLRYELPAAILTLVSSITEEQLLSPDCKGSYRDLFQEGTAAKSAISLLGPRTSI
jgi:hypothetical protein